MVQPRKSKNNAADIQKLNKNAKISQSCCLQGKKKENTKNSLAVTTEAAAMCGQ